MLASIRSVLRGCRCLSSHLQLAYLSLREPAVVIRAGARLLGLLLLGLLLLVLLLLLLLLLLEVRVHAGNFGVWSVRQVNACWRRWHLALCLEQARLEVDDVVAQLVVLGLQVLIKLA